MTIKSILVSLDGTEASHATLEAALTVAAKLSVSLDVLHVRPDSLTEAPALGDSMSGSMVEQFAHGHAGLAEERARAARAIFADICAKHGVPTVENGAATQGRLAARFVEKVGKKHSVFPRLARVHDLVIVGHPSNPKDLLHSLTIDALFESGRPTLVVPHRPPASFARTIAIAWNGSPECARALGGATNLFPFAESVVILTAESHHTPASVVEELAGYLERHGIKPRHRIIGHMGSKHLGGKRLLAATAEENADLLVMGAHRHRRWSLHRWREVYLGRATREVLEMAEIPVLMGH